MLPFDVTVEDLLSETHASRPRNKLVAQIFFDMGLIERYGGGIQRILDDCNASGLPPPVFENTQGGFRITFKPLPESTNEESDEGLSEGLNEGLKLLLDKIRQTPGIQAKELSDALDGRPIKTIERQIKALTDASLIERRGSKKTGGYHVK